MRPAALIDDLAQLVYDFAAQHEQQAAALQGAAAVVLVDGYRRALYEDDARRRRGPGPRRVRHPSDGVDGTDARAPR